MIGRVGRNQCDQLRGLLHSQQRKLDELEQHPLGNEANIAALKSAIESTRQKFEDLGCNV